MKKNKDIPQETTQPDAEELRAGRQQAFDNKKDTQQKAHLRRQRIRELQDEKDW
jgi:hypothetical protein